MTSRRFGKAQATARFVDVDGLSEDEAAEKIVAVQRVALRMLLPTERDTLGVAIKVLTEAIACNITLKRSVAGLPTMGALRPGDPATRLRMAKIIVAG